MRRKGIQISASILAAGLSASICHAGSVVNDRSLGGSPIAHAGSIFTIAPGSGKQVGTALFYSLSSLNLDAGESANFTGPVLTTFVLARVTGGASTIDGTLGCTIPGADLVLVNPAGVAFGPNAALDVGGAFAVTTADVIHLSDGVQFAAIPSGSDATLTSAAPVAFGFLHASSGAISAQGAMLNVTGGRALSIVGGDIHLDAATLQANAGRITLASAKSVGTVQLDPHNPSAAISMQNITRRGNITLNNGAMAMTDGDAGGQIVIRAGQLQLANSTIAARTHGAGDGTGIDVGLTGEMTLTSANISTNTNSTGNGGNLRVRAGSIAIDGQDPTGADNGRGLLALSNDTSTDAGKSGDVRVVASTLSLSNNAVISADSNGGSAAGNVSIQVAGDVNIAGTGGGIFAISTQSATSGDAGAIHLAAGSLSLTDSAVISASTYGAGHGGNVRVNAQTLSLTNQGLIASSALGSGDAGNVSVVVAQKATLDAMGNNAFDTGIISESGEDATGHAGQVTVSAQNLALRAGAAIEADTRGSGAGGTVDVSVAHRLEIDGTGLGGFTTFISADSLAFNGSDQMQGDAGTVHIAAQTLSIHDGGYITTHTFGSGNGGSILIDAQDMSLAHGANIEAGTLGPGNGGTCTINVSGTLTLDRQGATRMTNIDNESAFNDLSTSGNGGDLTIHAGDLSVLNGASLDTDTMSPGNSGDLLIHVDRALTLSGVDSFISSDSILADPGGGAAGNVNVSARTLLIANGAAISSSTFGTGNGGNIVVAVTGNARLDGQHQSAALTGIYSLVQLGAAGNAGTVSLVARRAAIVDEAMVSSATTGAGNANNVSVELDGALRIDGKDNPGLVTGIYSQASSGASGDAGDIIVTAASLAILDEGEINSSTNGTGRGGNITVNIAGPASLNSDGAHTVATGLLAQSGPGMSGDAGNLQFHAQSLAISDLADITSSTFGAGRGGNLSVSVDQLVNLDGNGQTSSITGISAQSNKNATGDSGNVVVSAGALRIVDDGEVSSSTDSTGNGGNVLVQVRSSTTLDGQSDQLNNTGIQARSFAFPAAGQISGRAGSVKLITGRLDVANGASLSSSSNGLGSAGSVRISSSGALSLQHKASVAVTALNGDGGSIRIASGQGITLADAVVSAQANNNGGDVHLRTPGPLIVLKTSIAAQSDLGNGGSIDIDPSLVVLDRSGLLAQAVHGNGGAILIHDTAGLLSFDTTINVSSTFGVSGTVQVQNPDPDVASAIIALPTVLPGGGLSLQPTCAQSTQGDQSSFIVTGTGGVAPMPGGWVREGD